MKSIKRGFTLMEMLVVLCVLGMIMAALTTSVASAQQRAKVARANAEVKSISQAILAYENYDQSHELPTMRDQDADKGTVGFLLGPGGSGESGKIPALLMAQLSSGGKMMDPWNTPYKISIREGGANIRLETSASSMQTGFHLPNFYRLSPEERK